MIHSPANLGHPRRHRDGGNGGDDGHDADSFRRAPRPRGMSRVRAHSLQTRSMPDVFHR